MEGLKYLDLSYSNFTRGTFPAQLGNLVHLQVLDASGVDLSGVGSLLPMLNKLHSLEVLSLSECQLDNSQISPPLYSNHTFLSSLAKLRLRNNSFVGLPFPHLLRNMTSLAVLDLSDNDFLGEIPIWLTDLKKLEYLDLSGNKFSKVEGGLMRILSSLCHLNTFDFSSNKLYQGTLKSNKNVSWGCVRYDLEELNVISSGLIGIIPDELGQFKKLKSLDLSFNALNGPVPASIGNLTDLMFLNLAENQLNSLIPAWLGNMLALTHLDIRNNHLDGAIPMTIANLSALTYLDLRYNQLYNVVPDIIGQLVNLEYIRIAGNYLTGNITETHLLNVTKLELLDFSSNELTINIAPDWIPPFQLRSIYMSSCKIGTVFPRWLGSQNTIRALTLSNAGIRGPWPKWFRSSGLVALDLSHNEISGHIPHNLADIFPELIALRLSNNSLSGTVPISLCKMNSLDILDISSNELSGKIPKCFEDTQRIRIVKLSFNQLTGVIPRNIGNRTELSWLSLNNNRFNGEIPSSLRNCKYLNFLNLGDNGFSGNIPTWIGAMTQLKALIMRNNSFDGNIPTQLCQMLSLHILDLAGNNLTGSIPSCIGNLTAMTTERSISEFKLNRGALLFTFDKALWGEEDLVIKIVSAKIRGAWRFFE